MRQSGRTSQFNLDRPIPILLGYWTADIAANGDAIFHQDVYGHDPRILAALQVPPGGYAIMPACNRTNS
jgi:murein L,D-transpeptidase YcbB/YkuD